MPPATLAPRRLARSPQASRLAPSQAVTPAAVQAAWTHGAVALGPARCPTCAAAIARTYCAVCGEQRRDARRFRMADVLARALEATLDFDGRALRTLRLLLTRPGALTDHFMGGRWKPYLRPLQLFVLVNVAFFVWAGSQAGFNTLTTPLSIHVRSNTFFHKDLAARWVDERVETRETTFEAYAETFDRRVDELSRSLVFLFLPFLALAFAALHPRRLAARHLAAACHFMAFTLLFMVLLGLAGWAVVRGGYALTGVGALRYLMSDLVLSLTLLTVQIVYLTGFLRRAYGDGWLRAVLGSVAVTAAFITILFGYRAVLFFLVFAVT